MPGGLNSALIKFLADRLVLSEEFVCQLLAGAMYIEGLTNGLIGSADEGLEGSPPVRSFDELADELRGCDTALACTFLDDSRNVVGQLNNRCHRAQRIYRPRQDSTDFGVALAEPDDLEMGAVTQVLGPLPRTRRHSHVEQRSALPSRSAV